MQLSISHLVIACLWFILARANMTRMKSLVELTDAQKQNLGNFCRKPDQFYILDLKPTPSFFNQDEEQCLESISSDTYFGIEFQHNPQSGPKIHAQLLHGCSGADQIYYTNMTTTTSLAGEHKCNAPRAILKMEAGDIQDIRVVGARSSRSYNSQSVQLVPYDTMIMQRNSTCLSFQYKTPTTKEEMHHNLHHWTICREVNETILPQSHPNCNVTIFQKHNVRLIEWQYSVFLGNFELATYYTDAMEWTKEEYPSLSDCIYEEQQEQTSTSVSPIPDSVNRESSENSDKEPVTTTELVFIIGGIALIILIAALAFWCNRRYKKSRS